jgi:hypothetical protein
MYLKWFPSLKELTAMCGWTSNSHIARQNSFMIHRINVVNFLNTTFMFEYEIHDVCPSIIYIIPTVIRDKFFIKL